MRAVITVVGKDMVGIVSRVAGACTTCNINVTEVTQSVLQDLFCMIMLADISKANLPFGEFAPGHVCHDYARGHYRHELPALPTVRDHEGVGKLAPSVNPRYA